MSIYDEVHTLLKGITIPKSKRAKISDRAVQSVTLGIVNQPFNKYKGLSKFTERHPELYSALCKLHDAIDPDHKFCSITVNKNVLCKPHKDRRNDGVTMIVGIGDYIGGELVIDDLRVDIKYKPYYFNGSLHTHYNLPWTGDRWSIMYYGLRGDLKISHRPEDVPIVREVYFGNQYHNSKIGFGIERGDRWIDIGANIGCFAKRCIDNGATVRCYEPDEENFKILLKNVDATRYMCYMCAVMSRDGFGTLKKGSRPYFHTVEMDAEYDGCGDLPVISMASIIDDGICIKMDIEGGEMAILDDTSIDYSGVRKMVFAYHTNIDGRRCEFERRMENLKKYFTVYHQDVSKYEKFNFFPNEIIVYCINKSIG